jgi:hypothetical protein
MSATGGSGGGAAGAGGGGTGGAGGMAGNGGVGGTAATGGIGSMGACDNPDRALLALLDPNARQIATNCGLTPSCENLIDETAFTDCVTTCVEQAVALLSSECSSCYGDYAWCSLACENDCATDSCGIDCLTCLGDAPNNTCMPELTQCTGRTMSLDCLDPT